MEEGIRKPGDAARARLVGPVGTIVTLIWAVSAGAGLFTGNFQGLEVVTPVMVIFVSYLFGISIVRTADKSPRLSNAETQEIPARERRDRS